MTPETYIDRILQKYQQAPGFPFPDWHRDSVSFYALLNLWDDLFRTASGQAGTPYVATVDVKMDPDSNIYDVTTPQRDRRITVHPEPEGGTFFVLFNPATEGFSPDQIPEGALPDRTELGFAMDIERNRLIAAFNMIRAYTHSDLTGAESAAAMQSLFEEHYASYFGFADFDPFAKPAPDDDDRDGDDGGALD